MAKRTKASKSFKFQRSHVIGSVDAETDSTLDDVFIDNGLVTILEDVSDQRSIIIGRTGSGKTALLKHLEQNVDNLKRIEPEEMSLRFLSNSTILTHFRNLGVNLDFFYKVLWKHVFIVELLKLHFGEDAVKQQNWLDSIFTFKLKKKNARRERAITYLRERSKDFWLYTETRVKEFERQIENSFSAETGMNVSQLSAKIGSGFKESDRIVVEYKEKAEKVINASQADEIFDIIEIMKNDLFTDNMKHYYIIIDDLDKDWIQTDIKYSLIGAMIEVVKEFRVFKGAKIIIALRDNLHQLVFAGINHQGGQREKFKPLYANIQWTESELKELVSKRLEYISNNALNLQLAFDKLKKNHRTGFDYMLERTFLRPRDVISFVNHTIIEANNRPNLSNTLIKKAESLYSQDRLQAIEDEWGENYGDINSICTFLIGRTDGFRLKHVKEDDFIEAYCSGESIDNFKGDLKLLIEKWINGNIKFTVFAKGLLFLLYTMGILGVKKGPRFSTQYVYEGGLSITENDFNNDCRFYIHKAFYSALGVNSQELEHDES